MLSKEGYGLLPITGVSDQVLKAFDCGKSNLNEFLRDNALEMHDSKLSSTSLVFHKDFDGLVGYFSLSNDAIPLSSFEESELGYNGETNLSAFPAVKIGRLATQRSLHRTGVGAAVMEMILGDVLGSKTLSVARILIVDADNDPKVIAFYESCGFERSQWAKKMATNHGGRGQQFTVKMIRDVLLPL